MDFFHMPGKSREPKKAHLAAMHLALVLFLLEMTTFVLNAVTTGCESSRTIFTFKWPFARMRPLVQFKVRYATEFSATDYIFRLSFAFLCFFFTIAHFLSWVVNAIARLNRHNAPYFLTILKRWIKMRKMLKDYLR